MALAALAIICYGGLAMASQPQIDGLSPDFVMKANLRGGPFTLKGSFQITWEEYVVTGTLGEGDSNKGSLKVTQNPRVVQSGNNSLELVCDTLEMASSTERLIAVGNVKVKAKELSVTTNYLEGGMPQTMKPVIAGIIKNLSEQVQNEVNTWLQSAAENDQIFVLQGAVAGDSKEVKFTGDILLMNSTTEEFIFAGPAHITYFNQE
jgi:hypothetical protein